MRLFVFLALFAALASGALRRRLEHEGANSTCDEPENSGSWSCTLPSRGAVLVLAAFIVVCGIVFDFLKEKLEEHVRKASRSMEAFRWRRC